LRDNAELPPPNELTEICADGYTFAVRLYWVEIEDPTTAAVSRFRRVNTAEGGASVGDLPPKVGAAWYEDLTFKVRPRGPALYEKAEGIETVSYGTEGWEVVADSRVLVDRVTMTKQPLLVRGIPGQ
jgi:hypothetical protein